MIEDDASYFQRRAEQEVEQAQRATQPEVVAVHYALANHYLERMAQSKDESDRQRPALQRDDAAVGSDAAATEVSVAPATSKRLEFG